MCMCVEVFHGNAEFSLHVSNTLENNRNFQRIDKYYWKSSLEKGGSKNSSMKTSFLGSMYVWPTPSPQMYEWRSADDCSLPQVERRNNAMK